MYNLRSVFYKLFKLYKSYSFLIFTTHILQTLQIYNYSNFSYVQSEMFVVLALMYDYFDRT